MGYLSFQRQLVATDCTPDAGDVSSLFGSDSHTIYPCSLFSNDGFQVRSRNGGKGRKNTYVAVGFFANELILELGVRR
jgi:hypothetical protein